MAPTAPALLPEPALTYSPTPTSTSEMRPGQTGRAHHVDGAAVMGDSLGRLCELAGVIR